MRDLLDIRELKEYGVVTHILVIGCGGTGGYVVPNLVRAISACNYVVSLFLADGDTVEEKNLIRQNFIHSDIGKNKADVLACRYSGAFGMEIGAITKDIENIGDIKYLLDNRNSLIIGCVDNVASRKVIYEWISSANHSQEYFWIDSGNEETAGQVVCGYSPPRFGYNLFSLPCVSEIYPNILDGDDRFNSQLSCAERAESSPQNIMTNVTAATLVMNFANKIINRQPLRSHAVEFGINNAFNTRLNTKENLASVNPDRKLYWEGE